ncbi:hypothetical protein BP6252_00006 [Coleophoma cylindrospora]|uniref:(S)-ureidoglycine aminohydrolase cupin domain-containing protein n=1 Tax=Coleophoma cylindrospora TaxID=1849047 RepID=A0A3D8SP62_9HELO|nr:hypothetical protein BP6252_00006 [Coleophoma cylindrospora]
MPLEVKTKAEAYKTALVFPGNPNLRLSDVHGSVKAEGSLKPLATGYFFLAKDESVNKPFPEYTYDETGIVIEGSLILSEGVVTKTLKAGDTFFIPKGSKIAFNTEDYTIVYKVGGRWIGEY